jgi:diacylglycerol kinase (ATP)
MNSAEHVEVLVVYNPKASAANIDPLHRLLEKYFSERRFALVECSRDDMASVLAPWLERGIKLIISAGGDGTVSDIATALPADGPPVGILPMGTGNVLARELDLPLDLEGAAALLAGEFDIRALDILRVEGRAYLLSVSAGLSARAMHETTPARKKIFGKSSYLVSLFLNFFNMRPVEYRVEADGEEQTITASDLMASNCGILGYKSLRWWPTVQPDDGHMDLCYLQAGTGFYYLWVVGNFLIRRHYRSAKLNYLTVKRTLTILEPAGMPVQGDGDMIASTPVEIHLEPAMLKIAVPRNGNARG